MKNFPLDCLPARMFWCASAYSYGTQKHLRIQDEVRKGENQAHNANPRGLPMGSPLGRSLVLFLRQPNVPRIAGSNIIQVEDP